MKKFLFTKNAHTFRTEKDRKTRKTLFWVIIISVVVLALATVSTLILLKNYDYDISNIVPDDESTSDTDNSTVSDVEQNVSGEADILLTLHNGDELKFACIVKADASEKTISVSSLEIDSVLSEKFSKADDKNRMSDFKTAVSTYSGIAIDRYINADYNQFSQAVSTMGGVTLNIPHDISYNKNDIMLSLKKGEWKLTGANLLNYILISTPSTQNDIISAILKEYITKKNYDNGENIYSNLVNVLDTDITAFDFNSALAALKVFAYSEAPLNITSFSVKG